MIEINLVQLVIYVEFINLNLRSSIICLFLLQKTIEECRVEENTFSFVRIVLVVLNIGEAKGKITKRTVSAFIYFPHVLFFILL
jgi:hypothetical protein